MDDKRHTWSRHEVGEETGLDRLCGDEITKIRKTRAAVCSERIALDSNLLYARPAGV